MKIESYTNSCVSCFRRCPREFDLRYPKRLERAGDNREVLQVGSTWHTGHDKASKAGDDAAAYEAILKHAPGPVWNEKLRRLFAAYRGHYRGHPGFKMLSSEHIFKYTLNGTDREGQIDGIVEVNGLIGNLERKTSGEDIDDGASYWGRLRMASQPSFYANAFKALTGKYPAFTLYDVVRKPTIRSKSIVKKDMARLRKELDANGEARYYEMFQREDVEAALFEGRETIAFYGARLTADIGDRPDFYFQRKMIPRTNLDLSEAERDTAATIALIEATGDWFPRNPDACATYGLCDFFELCSNAEYPDAATVPSGFARREHLHPELVTAKEETQ